MFDDQQQANQNDNLNLGTAPTIGLGTNPVSNTTATDAPTIQTPEPVTAPQVTLPAQDTVSAVNTTDSAADNTAPTELEAIKRQAIEELSPLVDKLDQTPEERYKTLIMLIQSTDNEALIPEAYKNAHKIADDKTRAEALLNIVNEINYLTNNKK